MQGHFRFTEGFDGYRLSFRNEAGEWVPAYVSLENEFVLGGFPEDDHGFLVTGMMRNARDLLEVVGGPGSRAAGVITIRAPQVPEVPTMPKEPMGIIIAQQTDQPGVADLTNFFLGMATGSTPPDTGSGVPSGPYAFAAAIEQTDANGAAFFAPSPNPQALLQDRTEINADAVWTYEVATESIPANVSLTPLPGGDYTVSPAANAVPGTYPLVVRLHNSQTAESIELPAAPFRQLVIV